ncbi:hypothetical protein [Streptomyces marianii]|uniref:Methylamine utilization protein MauE n=1 Tax=Streptomyces marianii TaxID=1817406 RepID=A0A5R9E0F7_9ACTN|nr:hypothetical protein [Streptomyces marianii]TLQ43156.1 hypothetical protein FEF34_08380 [Streptomyces marianii]
MSLSALNDMALPAVAGPLVIAGAAKLMADSGQLAWPIRSGPLALPWGPRLVGTAELLAAVGIVFLPGRWAAASALLAYAALTAVAARTKGQKCACFGLARLAAIGKTHIGTNAAGALLAAVALALPPGDGGIVTRAVAAAVGTAVMLGVLLAIDRRLRTAQEATLPCTEQVSAVRMYVADDCPSCRSLKHLLSAAEPERLALVTTVTVAKEAELPGVLHGLGVPCAIGLDRTGMPVCSPVSGIGAVKALVDAITLTHLPADTHGR